MALVTADRCPSCSAALRPDAAWCGQCYADLRPAPAPPQAAAPAGVPLAAAPPSPDPLEAPLTDLLGGAAAEPSPPAVAVAEAPAPASWPCGRCHTMVPFDEDFCDNCGAKFLDPALPGTQRRLVDRLPRADQHRASTAALVMVVGGLALTGLFVALFALLSTIF
ncbi:MAG: double zinc ribbon domain-containing protein [Actinomycetes bacterium]